VKWVFRGTTFIATGKGSLTFGSEGMQAVPVCPSGSCRQGTALGSEEVKLMFCSYLEEEMG
jgi:hypothetical protein